MMIKLHLKFRIQNTESIENIYQIFILKEKTSNM